MEDDDQLVEAGCYTSMDDFLRAKALLDSSGIECFADNENVAHIVGSQPVAAGSHGYRLFVWNTDLSAASSILLAEWPSEPGEARSQ